MKGISYIVTKKKNTQINERDFVGYIITIINKLFFKHKNRFQKSN